MDRRGGDPISYCSWICVIIITWGLDYWCFTPLLKIFHRKPPTRCKSLTNIITKFFVVDNLGLTVERKKCVITAVLNK